MEHCVKSVPCKAVALATYRCRRGNSITFLWVLVVGLCFATMVLGALLVRHQTEGALIQRYFTEEEALERKGPPAIDPSKGMVVFSRSLVEGITEGKKSWLELFIQRQELDEFKAQQLRDFTAQYVADVNEIAMMQLRAEISDEGTLLLLNGEKKELQQQVRNLLDEDAASLFITEMLLNWDVNERVARSIAFASDKLQKYDTTGEPTRAPQKHVNMKNDE